MQHRLAPAQLLERREAQARRPVALELGIRVGGQPALGEHGAQLDLGAFAQGARGTGAGDALVDVLADVVGERFRQSPALDPPPQLEEHRPPHAAAERPPRLLAGILPRRGIEHELPAVHTAIV